jgi:3-oxoacyl-[acyl-carrier-protein] synthase II
MKAVIKSSGIISPQPSHSAMHFPSEVHQAVTNRLACLEPEYKNLINPLQLRRMPRILKMGLAASLMCINRAGGISPDGIIVGTGLGCINNLEKFLMDVIDNEEHVTSVLPFINSTHNAVAAQISLMLKNHNYNTTYCHRGFSFESAVQDALMLINEKKANHVLVGGIDECTDDFMLLHSYLDDWKQPVNNLGLLKERSNGTIAGEGSSFFMLSGESSHEGAVIEAVRTFLTPENASTETILHEIILFLKDTDVPAKEIDGILFGLNGDIREDRIYYELMSGLFSDKMHMYYKHLCGEYYTSSAFALWIGSQILEERKVPEVLVLNNSNKKILNNILIYNQIKNSEHSLIYLRHGRL